MLPEDAEDADRPPAPEVPAPWKVGPCSPGEPPNEADNMEPAWSKHEQMPVELKLRWAGMASQFARLAKAARGHGPPSKKLLKSPTGPRKA